MPQRLINTQLLNDLETLARTKGQSIEAILQSFIMSEASRPKSTDVNDKYAFATQFYKTIADFTYDWEYWLAPDNHFIYSSPACERITGYAATDFLEDPTLLERLIDPKDRYIWDTHKHHQHSSTSPIMINFRIQHKDGYKVWIEHACHIVTLPDGTAYGYRASNRDITQRQQIAAELRQSQADLQVLLNNTPYAFIFIDKDRRVRLANLTARRQSQIVFGREPGPGDPIYLYVRDEDHKSFDANLNQALRGERIRMEKTFGPPDNPIWFEFIYSPISTDDGSIIGVCLASQNTTHQRQLKNREIDLSLEEERMRLLHSFLNNTAHDLWTPLTTIGTSVYLLKRTLPDPPRHLEVIETQARRLHRLLEDMFNMMDLDRLTDIKFDDLRILDVVYEILDELHPLAKNKELTINTTYNMQHCRVMGNAIHMGRALRCLLVNAITYAPVNSVISITILKVDEFAHIEISDMGPGIPAEQLPHIFERFYRGDKARGDSGGVGLGLTMALAIIKKHGGTIEVQTELNKGSTFTIILPGKTD